LAAREDRRADTSRALGAPSRMRPRVLGWTVHAAPQVHAAGGGEDARIARGWGRRWESWEGEAGALSRRRQGVVAHLTGD
jgi:hypothetical protein